MALADILPIGVVVEEGAPERCCNIGRMFPEEERNISRAVPRRKLQYRAARQLARRALRALGEAEVPVLNAEDRSPIWPPGVVGSITHTQGWCGVALARAGQFRGIGVDVESDEPLQEQLAERILTPAELAALVEQHPADWRRLAKLYFSAKESVYKCQYPTSGRFLGFEDVMLSFDYTARSFSVRFLVDVPGWPEGARPIQGRYSWRRGLVCSAAYCLQEDAAELSPGSTSPIREGV